MKASTQNMATISEKYLGAPPVTQGSGISWTCKTFAANGVVLHQIDHPDSPTHVMRNRVAAHIVYLLFK